jgi:hypothetical protein
MHYTIYNCDGKAIEVSWQDAPVEAHYVPGHDIGNGWRRHIVQLNAGDTATNPASTKRPLFGPGFIVYDVAPSGITAHEYNDSAEFYDAIGKDEIPKPPRQPISEVFLVWDDTRAEHAEPPILEKICATVDAADSHVVDSFDEGDTVFIEKWVVGNDYPSERIEPSR